MSVVSLFHQAVRWFGHAAVQRRVGWCMLQPSSPKAQMVRCCDSREGEKPWIHSPVVTSYTKAMEFVPGLSVGQCHREIFRRDDGTCL